MNINEIIIKGAREHNLKNVNVIIPRNKLTVMTGVIVHDPISHRMLVLTFIPYKTHEFFAYP